MSPNLLKISFAYMKSNNSKYCLDSTPADDFVLGCIAHTLLISISETF